MAAPITYQGKKATLMFTRNLQNATYTRQCCPHTILAVHILKLCKTVMPCWVNRTVHCQVNIRWVKCGWRVRSVRCTQLFTTLRAGYAISTLLYCWWWTTTVRLKNWNLCILNEEAVQQFLTKVTQCWSVAEASVKLWAKYNCTVHTRELEICGTKHSWKVAALLEIKWGDTRHRQSCSRQK